MQTTFALAALAAVAYAAPSALEARAPAGCSENYNGRFQITAINVTDSAAKRSLDKRAVSCDAPESLTITLADGILTDSRGSQGGVVANRQFQFDPKGFLQPDSDYTGFSVCSNGTLATKTSALFYQCLSGTFYNLYDTAIAAQCNPVYLYVMPCSGSGASNPQGQQPDGQPTGPVGQQPDGQPTGPVGGAPVTQIGDGQVQAPTGAPVTELADGQPQVPTGAPVTQIGDGQVQAPTGAPVTQIGDGQVQAPTATGAPVTQIGDGQVQAPTGAPVTQIGDGQVQAPTGAPVTQISDGQVQAPTGAPVTQIPDGQVQAPTNGTTSPVPFTGSSNTLKASTFGVVVAGLTALLL